MGSFAGSPEPLRNLMYGDTTLLTATILLVLRLSDGTSRHSEGGGAVVKHIEYTRHRPLPVSGVSAGPRSEGSWMLCSHPAALLQG